ncbi:MULTISPECIES: hypothetical protein [unclassified Dyella]|uniref:hypothetical protein n=1 Tax=unclassified Dyella TaxID=2634549 RepID=UPI000C8322ED|nr:MULTISPECIES: hypothetical protein [unclassified Dyella]MDR3443913.1 hypothetical protein [Dyella sp.]PMQ05186.1 hypothetical protein DyAD56_10970 [Dyella sp. AD56]
MKNQLLAILLGVVPTSGVLANDALLDQALARPGQASSAMSGIIVSTHTITGGPEPKVERETYDLRESPTEVIASYDDLRSMIGECAQQTSSENGRSIYQFKTIRASNDIKTPKGVKLDDSDQIEFEGMAEVIRDALGQPFVSHVHLHMHHAMGSMVGRIKTLNLTYDFSPSPDGRSMIATDATADANIRFLFFLHRAFRLKLQWSPTDAPVAQGPVTK